MDLRRMWLMSGEIQAKRVVKEARRNSVSLLQMLHKRQESPKEPIQLKKFPLTEKARREFIPALQANLKINFK